MLNHYLGCVCPLVGRANSLNLHSDSCTGKNKNNIVLGMLMTRVGLGFHEYIDWNLMTVGHTKFRPDEGFGHIRKHVGRRVDVMSMTGMQRAIKESAVSSRCVSFPVDELFDYKGKMYKIFKHLQGIKKNFAFRLHIGCSTSNGHRKVYVDVYHSPRVGDPPAQTVQLLRPDMEYCRLSHFEKDPPRRLPTHVKNATRGCV